MFPKGWLAANSGAADSVLASMPACWDVSESRSAVTLLACTKCRTCPAPKRLQPVAMLTLDRTIMRSPDDVLHVACCSDAVAYYDNNCRGAF